MQATRHNLSSLPTANCQLATANSSLSPRTPLRGLSSPLRTCIKHSALITRSRSAHGRQLSRLPCNFNAEGHTVHTFNMTFSTFFHNFLYYVKIIGGIMQAAKFSEIPAGKEIKVLTTGSMRHIKNARSPYFAVHLSAVSRSFLLIKNHFPCFSTKGLPPKYPR